MRIHLMAQSNLNNTESSSASASISSQLKDTPNNTFLWYYVTKGAKVVKGGGNVKWNCNFCKKDYQGSYTRVRSHLLGIVGNGIASCDKVPKEKKQEMINRDVEAATPLQAQAPLTIPLLCEGSISGSQDSNIFMKKRKYNDSAPKTLDKQNRKILDAKIARMFFTGGLPFNLARNPHYFKSFQFAANHNLSGYVPPSYNRLRTTLLQNEKQNIEEQFKPIIATWREKGVTIVSNGWSDPERTLINFMATSENGSMFIKSVNCLGEIKDKTFIANLIKDVILQVGAKNVVQLITDNTPNCKGAGEIIQGIFPHIYWTPCVVHTLNLTLKNICTARNVESNQDVYRECSWIARVYDDACFVKNFIMNHGMRLAIFNRFSSLRLVAVANTRFASVVVMLKRFKLLKQSLETMVLSDEYATYKEDDQGKADTVKQLILSLSWWSKIDYILQFTSPIYDMIRMCDTDKPCLHMVYEMWDCMIEKVKLAIYTKEGSSLDAHSSFYNVVHQIIVARWAKNNAPLHCLAHSLNPRYYTDLWLNEDPSRKAPHTDEKVSIERNKCFRRLFPDNIMFSRVLQEFGNFSTKSGPFASVESIQAMHEMDPRTWWANFGASAQCLQSLAFKMLGQPSSSSCCELNWSTYSFIDTLKRNSLTPERVEDLIFIHNNLRLLSRNNSKEYFEGKSKMWDVGGDKFDDLEVGGYLQLAELSLDEPELESVFFEDLEIVGT